MKHNFFFLIGILLILFTVASSTWAQIEVSINAPSRVTAGSMFTAEIKVEETVTDLDVASFSVSFNPSVLQFIEVQVGDLMTGASIVSNLLPFGQLNAVLNLPETTGVSGVGTIATLSFQAIRPISFSLLTLSGVVLGNTSAEPIYAVAGPPVRVDVIGESDDIVVVSVNAPAEVTENTDVTVEILVTPVNDLDTATFTLLFEPTVLELMEVTPGDLVSGAD